MNQGLKNNGQIIQDMFRAMFGLKDVAKEDILEYFSADYKQYVNGKNLNFNDLVKHIFHMRDEFTSFDVNFKHIVKEDNTVATFHEIICTKKIKKNIIFSYVHFSNWKMVK